MIPTENKTLGQILHDASELWWQVVEAKGIGGYSHNYIIVLDAINRYTAEIESDTMDMARLHKLTGFDTFVISKTVYTMQVAGNVVIAPNATDKRLRNITITQKGKDLWQKLRAGFYEANRIFEPMGDWGKQIEIKDLLINILNKK